MSKSGTCHVCGKRKPTGLYRDEYGNFLVCCEVESCSVNYEYLIPYGLFMAMVRWFSSARNAAEARIPFPTAPDLNWLARSNWRRSRAVKAR